MAPVEKSNINQK